jgi:hypothetical protein
VLTPERWAHIVEARGDRAAHPEMADHADDVLEAVRAPTRWMPDRLPGREWFYLAGKGPSQFIKVVVAFSGTEGRVVTAYPRRSFP